MSPKALVLVVPLAFAAASAGAATPPASTAGAPAPVVRYLKKQGLKVDARFSAPGGLAGYAATVPGGKHVVFYVPADGSVALFGALVDVHGRNLTETYMQRYVRGPANRKLYAALAKHHWIAAGDANPRRIVYAFVDPNCPYCQQFWEAAQKAYGKGVQVRYLVVGVLGGSSVGKAAAILASPEPREALDRNERNFRHHSGGIDPLKPVPAALRKKIRANTALMQKFGFDGTPGLVWKDAHGNVHTSNGLPPAKRLARIFGTAPAKDGGS